MKLVFATNNVHKLEEIKQMLGDPYTLVSLKEIQCFDDIPEEQDTLEGNALQKARYIHERYGIDCFADDTGLEIEALDMAPGVYSARYAGTDHNSEANMKKVLSQMNGVTNRKARFRTVIALIINRKEYLFEGIVNGHILPSPKGDSGFGYDPIFQPEGFAQSFAEMNLADKNKISHRGRAVEKLCIFLKNREDKHGSN
ncbi:MULTISPECIES: non-canonical purine NTP diphosphatase [Porphyromonadaceae]|uniref:dITP/XTP pyrophosphatase n=1 Tax=Sanguibacteroides justesenii TaxID=1547597 RepID=A0A0C3RDN6_9PORP|nr:MULTISPECIES: non-canonical purine NTP diphosphatase [Porphyromonadaceae]KIO44391.1 deoxyribonucleotide triphosphate pyrophosphatase [Sanguibacteroides justesenii]KIO45351.1 deoxyribonucleotide triphosphate pyrophosphatase [Sanguibacteroides justesenii]PXZ44639.1 non-canonical purine NTP diphosphatase [Sanguibacteroides justesenii]